MNLSKKTSLYLLQLHGAVLRELRRRGVVRTNNGPVADYAEYLVAKKLKLELAPSSQKSFDATDEKTGTKYQIKSRRHTARRQSLQLGVIRNLEKSDFDFLVAVIFNEDFSVQKMYQIPRGIISKHARYSKHQNGYILILRGPILKDKRIKILR